MIKDIMKKLVKNENLTENEAYEAMKLIMSGDATQAQIGGYVTALRMKGETIEEITGSVKAMREKATKIAPDVEYCIDTCGTGGDGSNTFNISTAVAFIAAAAGVKVAKHGNRALSSKCGSSDVLEALGVNIGITPEQVKECVEKIGIGFMFAPTFHKSMKYAAGPRKEIGIRCIFNILGPLTNPALAKGQVMGVFNGELTNPLANVLKRVGVERAMVVHGLDGLDEISTTTKTKVTELKENGDIIDYELDPLDYNIKLSQKEDLLGGEAKECAEIIKNIFRGEKGPKADIVLLNAAAALYVGKITKDIKEGITIANSVINDGSALEKINEMVDLTNKF